MEYTVLKLARLAGVSARTLRYYDQIGLLKPMGTNGSGYRVYGEREVDRLQLILFYRELGMGLKDIHRAVHSREFDELRALREHREKLREKKDRLAALIRNVDKTIAQKEGKITMTDSEKFEGFKRNLVEENEEKYGAEIREKYGAEEVERANGRLMGLTKEQYERAESLSREILSSLSEAVKTGDPASPAAQKTAALHREWLLFFWDSYSKEKHAGLGNMYVEDERFRAYYDAAVPGAAEFLRDAILVFTGMK